MTWIPALPLQVRPQQTSDWFQASSGCLDVNSGVQTARQPGPGAREKPTCKEQGPQDCKRTQHGLDRLHDSKLWQHSGYPPLRKRPEWELVGLPVASLAGQMAARFESGNVW